MLSSVLKPPIWQIRDNKKLTQWGLFMVQHFQISLYLAKLPSKLPRVKSVFANNQVAASEPFEIVGQLSSASSFDIIIDTAVLTDLNGKPIQPEVVHLYSDFGHSQRLSKSLDADDIIGSTDEPTLMSSSGVPTLRYLDDESVATLASNTTCGFCEAKLGWGATGVIQSPNYPDPYGPNMDCLWLLMALDIDARIEVGGSDPVAQIRELRRPQSY